MRRWKIIMDIVHLDFGRTESNVLILSEIC